MNRSRFLTAMTLLAFAACNDAAGTGPAGRESITLSFTTQPQPVAPLSRSASLHRFAPSPLIVAAAGDELVVSKVQLVLSELEFKRSVVAECDNSGEDKDPECEEIELGPMLVDLPVTEGISATVSVTIPSGTYREMEADIDAVEFDDREDDDHGGNDEDNGREDDDDDHDDRDFLAAHPDFAGVSVRVEGTFNGQPFVYVSAVEAELEFDFTTPLVVHDNGVNVTINVDLSRWFRDSSGNLIDPHTASAGGPNALRVNENIKASFDAFEDHDRDGDDDADDDSDDGDDDSR